MSLISKNCSEFFAYLESFPKGNCLVEALCPGCEKPFTKTKKEFRMRFLPGHHQQEVFCTKQCSDECRSKRGRISVNCLECNKLFEKKLNQTLKCPNNFCSSSCSAKYGNRNKKSGYRRSKIEVFLEREIKTSLPHIKFITNDRSLGYELDFYFPDLRFAIELNGIFHYEPIYSNEQFIRIQNADKQKATLCREAGIELCILDISSVKRFGTKELDQYKDIVLQILNSIQNRLS